jgi:hypothetical protein
LKSYESGLGAESYRLAFVVRLSITPFLFTDSKQYENYAFLQRASKHPEIFRFSEIQKQLSLKNANSISLVIYFLATQAEWPFAEGVRTLKKHPEQ